MAKGKPEADCVRELIETAFERCAAQAAAPRFGGFGTSTPSGASTVDPSATATSTAPNNDPTRGNVPAGGAPIQPANDGVMAAQSTVVVGEVLDTHNPHLPGRVLVRWLDPQGEMVDRWLQRERHLSLRKGDNVLLTLPAGRAQWVVTGALGREPSAPLPDADNERELHLNPRPGAGTGIWYPGGAGHPARRRLGSFRLQRPLGRWWRGIRRLQRCSRRSRAD